MWDRIGRYFTRFPAQGRVAQLMFLHGLTVKEHAVFCGDMEISDTSIAKAANTDRRTVLAAIDTIRQEEELRNIFTRLIATCSFKDVAPYMGWGVIEIIPEDVSAVGILSETTRMIADAGISVRQTIADDPDMHENPRAFIITERPVPGALVPRIRDINGVKGVVIY